ncbi:MAG: primosomal protein N', partial [Bacteroidetes bacterium]
KQFDLWKWIADYYFCTIGEVFRAALPSGLKLESKSKVFIKNNDFQDLNNKEQLIINYISQSKKAVFIDDINKLLNQKSSISIIKKLHEKGIIEIDETLQTGFKPKQVDFLKSNFDFKSDKETNLIFEKLKRAKKQYNALINLIDFFIENPKKEFSKKELVKISGESLSIVNQLIKKDLLVVYKKQISRIIKGENVVKNLPELTGYQSEKYKNIIEAFNCKKPVLLHGITSSGKTEIYIRLINEQLKKQKQILYLLPEISLSTQIVSRLIDVFGDKIGIFHSKYPNSEKVELWNDLLTNQKKQIIIGARSAIFLPFSNLGLIIVDEEHDSSYKQQNPAPRYNARDTALIMSKIYNSNVILGSATPSIESYYNSQIEKYVKVELNKRYGDVKLPEIKIADMRKAYLKKRMISVFTPDLYNEIKKTLADGEQIILFQNRRGFSPFVECSECGWVSKCKKCDVSLSYHKYNNSLRCHYCGYSEKIPDKCPVCGNTYIKTKGIGTEKIEDEIKNIFPDAVVKRMDYDTAKTRNDFIRIIDDFQQQKINILVGTQMVSKGFDFDNVGLIGIINADNMMHFADFRSYEHTFQLITQVSGRAGRREKQGRVVIQTFDVENSILQNILINDYLLFYKTQIEERKIFKYPPFYRLIDITVKNRNINKLNKFSNNFAKSLSQKFDFVLGPESPSISKINNFYLKKILIKVSKTKNYSSTEKDLLSIINYYLSSKKMFSSIIVINRDF